MVRDGIIGVKGEDNVGVVCEGITVINGDGACRDGLVEGNGCKGERLIPGFIQKAHDHRLEISAAIQCECLHGCEGFKRRKSKPILRKGRLQILLGGIRIRGVQGQHDIGRIGAGRIVIDDDRSGGSEAVEGNRILNVHRIAHFVPVTDDEGFLTVGSLNRQGLLTGKRFKVREGGPAIQGKGHLEPTLVCHTVLGIEGQDRIRRIRLGISAVDDDRSLVRRTVQRDGI